jgi:hypothetical protein
MLINIRLERDLKHCLALLLILLLSSGCSSSKLDPKVRQQQADAFAVAGSLVQEKIQTNQFLLTIYQRFDNTDKNKDKDLTVYIEGDGMAWISRDQLSTNPTPIHPIALELASLDKKENILYIARPCQYLWPKVTIRNCSSEYWNNKRGSEEVIDSINQVITIIKARKGVSSINLIGYSGGGGVAALITARRDDVKKLITVAGNLNYQLFTQMHNLTPMNGSMDPITVAKRIKSIPQLHYVGSNDKIVPEQIARSFSDDVVVVDGITHTNWAEKWEIILMNAYERPLHK